MMWSVSRLKRGTWTVRPRARRSAFHRFQPGLQPLEARQLLSSATADLFAPTDAEQYMLELVNRARANPVAEGQRLFALSRTDPVLSVSTRGWDLSKFVKVQLSFRGYFDLYNIPFKNNSLYDFTEKKSPLQPASSPELLSLSISPCCTA